MKRLVFLVMLFIIFTPAGARAADMAYDMSSYWSDPALSGELESLDGAIDAVSSYLGEALDTGALQQLWQRVKNGELPIDINLLWRVPLAAMLGALPAAVKVLGQLVVLAAFGLLLVHLPGRGIAPLARQVVYLALFGVVLQVFVQAGGAASGAVEEMSSFLYALLPVLLTLLASLGAPSTVALYNPLLLAAIGSSLHLLRILVLPLLYISGALTVGGSISPSLKFAGLAKLCRDIGMGVFGIMLTLFGALLGLLGVSGAVLDGLGVRAAKSAAGVFIPVVGRTLADSLDAVVSTALLLKNLIGVLGLVILLLLCIMPAVRILVYSLLFRLVGALVEPLGDSRLAGILSSMGGIVLLFFGIVAISGLFFFFIVSITIGMGNLVVAIR